MKHLVRGNALSILYLPNFVNKHGIILNIGMFVEIRSLE